MNGNKEIGTEKNDKYPEDNEKQKEDFKVSGWGYRHQQCLVLFFTLTIAYSIRACIGVAVVAMTHSDDHPPNSTFVNNNTDVSNKSEQVNTFLDGLMWKPPGVTFIYFLYFLRLGKSLLSDGENDAFVVEDAGSTQYPKFKWDKTIQDSVSASFFWGYMVLQIPASQLVHRYGCRKLIFGSLMVNCVVTICLPWATYYGGWIFTIICRIVLGLSQSFIVPGMHTFFGKWAPLEERGRLTGLAYGGQALGAVLGIPITGFIADSPLGWPGIFRFYGILCGIIAVVIFFTIADSPAQHPKISRAEREYIENGLGHKEEKEKKKHLPIPWTKILTYPPMYAIVIAHIAQSWGQITLFTEIPSFMDKVLGVNIKTNGMLCALPFLVMWFSNFFFSWLTDMLIVKKILSVTNVRKLATTLGYLPSAIGLGMLAFLPKNIWVVEIMLCVICIFKISAHVGFMVNHIDISPNFAGTMMSLSNFTSNFMASLAPMVAGFILTDVTSERLWGYVFLVASGIYLISNLVYVILGDAELADWNEPSNDEEEETKAMILIEKNLKPVI